MHTALAGLTVLVLGIVVALNARSLPVIGDGTGYAAEFSEAAGLRAGDDVRIAGVKVGRVAGIALDGASVRVSFRVSGAWLGADSTASIRLKTVLGQKYLALDPVGSEQLDPDVPIPRARTTALYDVLPAFQRLSTTIDRLDTARLSRSFQAITQAFAHTPASVRTALDGLSRLSDSVASRDAQLTHLLAGTRAASATLAGRDAEVHRLLLDGNRLLTEVQRRESAISALLEGSRRLATELSGLVSDNDRSLAPVLAQLSTLLQRDQDSLAEGIRGLAPLIRLATNLTGNGHWVDGYLCGLLPPAIGPVNEPGCFPR
ncbi:phospholipid/cholesterol/gamma-HCH transport system substrate-binding protein [Amycolatopsis jiangsuensis]|uniref:Phospholipid/cholesterol/gamma-HCH transport system substrate-binding protein n=1 Tax=Amycolatopsis jiangsuensis TaxID=1181879 RepID=A0A840J5I4_9PSEU|nr:phospholipid/cholesterol/gamma-HCH transport system substrate-binding protein [Amycolatopsis jiangsuensis]